MEIINIETWNRKQHYEHFSAMKDPFFGITVPFEVSKAYQFSKAENISFFGKYLHDCMRAINAVDALKLRIENSNVLKYNVIHASPTIIRLDKTFGFSFVKFHEDLSIFLKNLEIEKNRVWNTNDLYPPTNSLDCIHCSAMPWVSFTGHKEPISGEIDSIPKLAFSKMVTKNEESIMNVSIRANHALVDGYDIGLFVEKFQYYLNN